MKKFLIAAAAAITFFPGAAIASVYTSTVTTVAVAYCRYQLGYNTMEEVVELSENYLASQGYSDYDVNRAMSSSSFDDDVAEAIYAAGGCEKILS